MNDKNKQFSFLCSEQGATNKSVGENKMKFYNDSGATKHISNEKDKFNFLRKLKRTVRIVTANDGIVKADHIGEISVKTMVNGIAKRGTLKNVLFAPHIRHNLLSVSTLDRGGIKVQFCDGKVELVTKNEGETLAVGYLEENLYTLEFEVEKDPTDDIEFAMVAKTTEAELWHRRLGHVSQEKLLQLYNYGKIPGSIKKANDVFCETCVQISKLLIF